MWGCTDHAEPLAGVDGGGVDVVALVSFVAVGVLEGGVDVDAVVVVEPRAGAVPAEADGLP
jgi:hypothetical protein